MEREQVRERPKEGLGFSTSMNVATHGHEVVVMQGPVSTTRRSGQKSVGHDELQFEINSRAGNTTTKIPLKLHFSSINNSQISLNWLMI
jgi:hypothetical protein